MSISEEQSTRKHNHLKSGSMPEFASLKNTGGNLNNSSSIINMTHDNSAVLSQNNQQCNSDQNLRSFSLQNKGDIMAMITKDDDKDVDEQEQIDPNSQTKDNDAEI